MKSNSSEHWRVYFFDTLSPLNSVRSFFYFMSCLFDRAVEGVLSTERSRSRATKTPEVLC